MLSLQSRDEVVAGLSDDVVQLEKLSLLAEQRVARSGAYLLTGKTAYLPVLENLKKAFNAQLARLRSQGSEVQSGTTAAETKM